MNSQKSEEQFQQNHVGSRHQGNTYAMAWVPRLKSSTKGRNTQPQTPQFRQSAITECGLAALAIIFAWHGVDVSLEKLRNEIGSTRLGLTARQLLMLARRYDFDTKACRCEIDQLAALPRPFIAHSRFIHFVVVEDVSDHHVTINDPGLGPQRLTLDEFSRDFTGVSLIFTPCRAQRPIHPARREFLRQLRDNRLPATMILFLCILQTSAVATGLATMASAVDRDHAVFALLPWISAAILHVLLHRSIEGWADRLAIRAQKHALRHFRSMPPRWFALKTASQLADILTLGDRWSVLLPGILALVRSLLLTLVLLVGPWIALTSGLLVTSLTAIASCIVFAACLRRGETRMGRMRSAQLLTLPGAHILSDLESRQFGGRDAELASHLAGEHAHMQSQDQINLDWQTKLDVLMLLPLVIALAISFAEGLVYGNWGTSAALVTLCVIVGLCLKTARRNFSVVNDAIGLLARIDDLRSSQGDNLGKETRPRLSEGLAIHLQDVDLLLNTGDLLQITGPSGSGKTRLARQIAGLEPCLNGAITFSGEATEILCHLGSSQVMFVDHQVFTISASLADNLRLGETRFDRSALEGVLHIVELNQELRHRGGLDLELCADRHLLSGGQLRRLMLACALLRQPSVIVLDGTLDSLDAPLAGRIVRRLRERHTVVLVGERGTELHRPNAIIDLGRR